VLLRAIVLLLAIAAPASDIRDAQASSIDDALRLGRSQDASLYAAFTKNYELTVSSPVASAEVITEFRRAVLIVREHMQRGEVGYTDHELTGALKPYLGQVTFIANVNLHPLNTYSKMPAYDIYVSSGATSAPIASETPIRRDPIYAMGPPGSPLVGLRLEVALSREKLDAARAPELIVTNENADVVWRGRIDLSRYR
jgi:hypothetical protein